MSTKRRLLAVILTLAMLSTFFITPVAAASIDAGLDKLPDPIDPQSFKLQKDMVWDELNPNPVFDWMNDWDDYTGPTLDIKGAIILVDFWDRKFISSQPVHTDLLGYFRYGDDYITMNPMRSIPTEQLSGWWADFLNKPQSVNNGLTIDEYWRENSYGQWNVSLDGYGPFTLDGFEFEFGMDSYMTFQDIPPAFRFADTGRSGARNFDREATVLARENGVVFDDYDFFFLLHAGYDESGVWQEFGEMQWVNKEDVPYELGPAAKMEEIEEIFTEHPEYVEIAGAKSYNSSTMSNAAAEVAAHRTAGTLDQYEFKFPDSDWQWATDYGNWAPTRYVEWTSWAVAVGIWSHMSRMGTEYTGASQSMTYSTQGESDGMATFAHEFGHVRILGDNYGNPFGDVQVRAATGPWDIMSRGSFGGPGGDHYRWEVPGVTGSSVPVNLMLGGKRELGYLGGAMGTETTTEQIWYKDLATTTPLVAEVVARNVPVGTEFGVPEDKFTHGILIDFSADATDQAPISTAWEDNPYRKTATTYAVEVVQRTGYDSFLNDHGVLIARNTYRDVETITNGSTGGNPFRNIVDSHPQDIDLVDYTLNGQDVYFTLGHQMQLADATFHAGISDVDTGYYDSNGDVISGNTVNEWSDPYNKLNFYILDKHMNQGKYGEFLSYEIGVLRTDGVPVDGDLIVEQGDVMGADKGKIAVQELKITNTGTATDIVRVSFDGPQSGMSEHVTMLNNLYSIGAGETITVELFIEMPTTSVLGRKLVVDVQSESNATKNASITIEATDFHSGNLRLITAAQNVKKGDTFSADAYFVNEVSSNAAVMTFNYNTSKFDFVSFEPAAGVAVVLDNVTSTGAQFTVMVTGYTMEDLGTLTLKAKSDINLTDANNIITLYVDYVVKDELGNKTLERVSTNTMFSTSGEPETPEPIVYDMLALSDAIDAFGMKYTDYGWNNVKKFDFNGNNRIDISDLAEVARRILA